MEKYNEKKRKNALFCVLIKKGEQLPRWQLGCGQLDIQPMREYQAKFRLQSLSSHAFFFGRGSNLTVHRNNSNQHRH